MRKADYSHLARIIRAHVETLKPLGNTQALKHITYIAEDFAKCANVDRFKFLMECGLPPE